MLFISPIFYILGYGAAILNVGISFLFWRMSKSPKWGLENIYSTLFFTTLSLICLGVFIFGQPATLIPFVAVGFSVLMAFGNLLMLAFTFIDQRATPQ